MAMHQENQTVAYECRNCDRDLGGDVGTLGASPGGGEDAELIALGVGQDDPWLIPLTNVDAPRAVGDESGYLGVLVIGTEVEVQSTLGRLGLVEPDEVQPRHAIGFRPDLELVGRGVDDDPAKRVGPPLPQARWVHRVNKYLFPFQGHRANLDQRGVNGHRSVVW